MAGSFPGVSNTQQHDLNGVPLSACLLTVYQGGTTQLASTFQDIGLTLPASNPLVADASGRIPLFFVADGSYAVRLTDQFGVQSNGGFYYPQIPSIGASTSGGGGTPVDPTTVAATGDVKFRLENTTISGWVRINGRTIGNATSGANERANADCQALYIYIWSTYADAICPVVGGRGASALADFNASKQITLLDARGRDIRGLDDMGNAALGAFTGVTFTKGNATTGGASGGANSTTLSLAQLPTGITSANASQAISVNQSVNGSGLVRPIYGSNGTFASAQATGGASFVVPAVSLGGNWDPISSISGTNSISVISSNTGGQAFPSVPSALLGTAFWKL